MISNRMNELMNLLDKDNHDSFLLFAIAKEYENNHMPDQAENYYLELKRVDPSYVGLYYHLAKLYEELGKTENALEIYGEGVFMAGKLNDQHAMSELKNAKMNLELMM